MSSDKIDIYNLGTGKGSSVLKWFMLFEKANDVAVPYQICERRAGDITIAYANADKTEKELGWKSETSLEEATQNQNASRFLAMAKYLETKRK